MVGAAPSRILAIETSCDETAAAVVGLDGTVFSSIVASQVEVHARFGGVVPEIASRRHLETVNDVVERAMAESATRRGDLASIAVTAGPGLVGALLVGMTAAKAYAYAWGLPIVYVDHIEAHIWANFAGGDAPPLPALCLVVSGGHTSLYTMDEERRLTLVGETIDDAVGEAFDKVARVLELPYPGGPHVERLAREAVSPVDFPVPMLEAPSLDVSLSGLKTAVAYYVRERGLEHVNRADVAAGFQNAVCAMLRAKLKKAARRFAPASIIAAGGVLANGAVRASLRELSVELGIPLRYPHVAMCTDNAAMVGIRGAELFRAGQLGDFARPAYSISRAHG